MFCISKSWETFIGFHVWTSFVANLLSNDAGLLKNHLGLKCCHDTYQASYNSRVIRIGWTIHKKFWIFGHRSDVWHGPSAFWSNKEITVIQAYPKILKDEKKSEILSFETLVGLWLNFYTSTTELLAMFCYHDWRKFINIIWVGTFYFARV